MALRAKRLVLYRRHLDTIMEAPEIQDNVTPGCLDSVSPQKSVATLTGGKTQHVKALRRKMIALPYTQMHSRTEQKESKALNSRSFPSFPEPLLGTCKNGERKRIHKENNYEAKKKTSLNLRYDMKQVEVLFPEFFSCGTNTYLVQKSRNYCDEYQNEMDLVNKKVKEDPLIRSWLNLFGDRSDI